MARFLHVKGKPTKCLDIILSDHGQISILRRESAAEFDLTDQNKSYAMQMSDAHCSAHDQDF